MAFRPVVQDRIQIASRTFLFTEHPSAKGMPYGQSGRRGTVYQLADEQGDNHYALKVFTHAFRSPMNEQGAAHLKAFTQLPGMGVCQRRVITPSTQPDLIQQYPDLSYAILMPWVKGSTWQEIILNVQPLSKGSSEKIAAGLLNILVHLEQNGIAHCDLSGPNVLVYQPETSAPLVNLVDVEDLYAPGMQPPVKLPGGSAGYGHRTASGGLWSVDADRFAGAMLLAEMLAWCDPRVRRIAFGEQYFDPKELQTGCERLQVMRTALMEQWNSAVVELFEQAWFSLTLADCPTFVNWQQALPGAQIASPAQAEPVSTASYTDPVEVQRIEKHLENGEYGMAVTEAEAFYRLAPGLGARPYARALLSRGFARQKAGDLDRAVEDFRLAMQVAPSGSLRDEIAAVVDDAQRQLAAPGYISAGGPIASPATSVSSAPPPSPAQTFSPAEPPAYPSWPAQPTAQPQVTEQAYTSQKPQSAPTVSRKQPKIGTVMAAIIVAIGVPLAALLFLVIVPLFLPRAAATPTPPPDEPAAVLGVALTAEPTEAPSEAPTEALSANDGNEALRPYGAPSDAFLNLPEPIQIRAMSGSWEMVSSSSEPSNLLFWNDLLWVATEGGVAVIDPTSGEQKVYTAFDGLQVNSIQRLAISPENELWATSWEVGVNIFDGNSWRFLEGSEYHQLKTFDQNGTAWFSSYYDSGIASYSNGEYIYHNEFLHENENVIDILAGEDGSVWVLTNNYSQGDYRLHRYHRDDGWQSFDLDWVSPDAYYVIPLGVSPGGGVWLAEAEPNGYHIYLTDGYGIVSDDIRLQTDGYITTSAVKDGVLWLSISVPTANPMISLYRVINSRLEPYEVSDFSGSNYVNQLYFDANNSLWISSNPIYRVENGQAQSMYELKSDLAGIFEVDKICLTGNTAWLATFGGGLVRKNDADISQIRYGEGVTSNYFASCAAGENVWAGGRTDNGFIYRNAFDEWESYGPEEGVDSGGYVWSMDTQGEMAVAGTANGVAIYDGSSWSMSVPLDMDTMRDIRAVAIQKGGIIWAGSIDGQTARLQNGEWEMIPSESLGHVSSIKESPSGTLYAAGWNGLYRFKGETWELVSGSPDTVTGVAFKADGSFWITTEFYGVFYNRGDEWIQQVSVGDNILPGYRMYDVAVAADGSIWFAGDGGAVRYRPER